MHRIRLRGIRACAVTAAAGLAIAVTPATAAERYVALGDSFSAGAGTREYSDACQRSIHAYPAIVARERATTELVHAACSGATTAQVTSTQLSAVTAATAIVTITIGGNDADYVGVLASCARPWPWTCWSDIERARALIRDQLPGRLSSLYGEIRRRAPRARVVALGYPRLFNGETCNVGARLSAGEQRELNATSDLLRDVTRGRAQAAGFTFVDATARFAGHAVCDDVEWINGLSYPPSNSYHPNRAGHRDGYAPLLRAVIG